MTMQTKFDAYLWQGAQDQNAPVAMSRYVAEAISDSHLTVYPDEGHISVMANHTEEIFGTFIAEQ